MQQDFLNVSSEKWSIIFLVTRYVVVALILAYITNVFVKRKAIHTDIKGRVFAHGNLKRQWKKCLTFPYTGCEHSGNP